MLKDNWQVRVSAPCRLHIGGALDMKPLAFPLEYVNPSTTTFALDLRTEVVVVPSSKGLINISGRDISATYTLDNIPFDSNLGLISAIISIFRIDGIEIKIQHTAPPRSGLGGSGTLAVCIIAALDRVRSLLQGLPIMTKQDICILAHDIEDGFRYSVTGLQDQCAAAFGGIYKWSWTYSSPQSRFVKEPLIIEYKQLEDRIVLAYVGKENSSIDVCSRLIDSFRDSQLRLQWPQLCQVANTFAYMLPLKNWRKLIELANKQMLIYYTLLPELVGPTSQALWDITKEYNASFNKLGMWDSGCCWSLCSTPEEAIAIKSLWGDLLANINTARILDCKIARDGLIIEEGIT